MIASVPSENLPPEHHTRQYKRDEPSENFDVVHRRRSWLLKHHTLIFDRQQHKKQARGDGAAGEPEAMAS
jgi:hypothetical protein